MSGRVQGVGFRAFCVRTADTIGLDGWVRNLPDGRVEVVASGSHPDLERMGDALGKGPGFACVEDVRVSVAEDVDAGGPGFGVRYGP